jgi:hypothetical protein
MQKSGGDGLTVNFKTTIGGMQYEVQSELTTRTFINGVEIWLPEDEAFVVNCEAVNLMLDME